MRDASMATLRASASTNGSGQTPFLDLCLRREDDASYSPPPPLEEEEDEVDICGIDRSPNQISKRESKRVRERERERQSGRDPKMGTDIEC